MDINDLNAQESFEQTIHNQTKKLLNAGTSFDKNSIVIGDDTYKIKLLPFEHGINLWEDIMKRLLPSIGNGLDQLQHNELDGNPNTFSYALANLSRQLDGSVLKNYSQVLFHEATVNGQKLTLDHFKGNYGSWRKLLVFAIKENFSSFFEEGWTDGLSQITAVLAPMMGSQE